MFDLKPIVNESQQFLPTAQGWEAVSHHITITDDTDLHHYAEDLRSIKGDMKRIEAWRKDKVRAADEFKKAVQDLVKPIVTRLETAEKAIKSEIERYTAERDKKALEARQEADKAIKEARTPEEASQAMGQYQDPELPEGVSIRETVVPTVKDIQKLCLAIGNGEVSTKLVTANMPEIKKLLKAGVDVPGVEFTTKRAVVARGD